VKVEYCVATSPKSWRDLLPVHEAADLFPLMSEAELRELGEDIKANGLQFPIIVYDDQLIDGRNRLDAMALVGIEFEIIKRRGCWVIEYYDDIQALKSPLGGSVAAASVDPYDYVVSANIHRRQLTAEQKRAVIAKLLKAKPEASDRTIAKQTKVDHKTVGKARAELEGRGEIPHVEKRTDTKGRKQRSAKRKKTTSKLDPIVLELMDVSEGGRQLHFGFREDTHAAKLNGNNIDVSKLSPKAQAAIASQTGEVDIETRKAQMAALDKQPDDPSSEELVVQRFIFAADSVIETAKDAREFLSKVQLSEESTAKIGEAVDRVIAAWQSIKERKAEYAASEAAA
jgi:hypothetical protein